MFLDIILTLITLTVAVIGTLLKDPTKRVKGFLIGLEVVASSLESATTSVIAHSFVFSHACDDVMQELQMATTNAIASTTEMSILRAMKTIWRIWSFGGFNNAMAWVKTDLPGFSFDSSNVSAQMRW